MINTTEEPMEWHCIACPNNEKYAYVEAPTYAEALEIAKTIDWDGMKYSTGWLHYAQTWASRI
jgi:hypothetical protein